jgi:hypothetical protein
MLALGGGGWTARDLGHYPETTNKKVFFVFFVRYDNFVSCKTGALGFRTISRKNSCSFGIRYQFRACIFGELECICLILHFCVYCRGNARVDRRQNWIS